MVIAQYPKQAPVSFVTITLFPEFHAPNAISINGLYMPAGTKGGAPIMNWTPVFKVKKKLPPSFTLTLVMVPVNVAAEALPIASVASRPNRTVLS